MKPDEVETLKKTLLDFFKNHPDEVFKTTTLKREKIYTDKSLRNFRREVNDLVKDSDIDVDKVEYKGEYYYGCSEPVEELRGKIV